MSFSSKLTIEVKENRIFYTHFNLGKKEIIQSPIKSLSKEISFSRLYHIGPIVSSIIIFILSVVLIIKKWTTHEWTLYLGLITASIVGISFLFYMLKGKEYGEVKLSFGGTEKLIYMTSHQYYDLKKRLQSI